MNVIPTVGPDTAIAPRTGSGSPQTPPQQRADAAPSVLSDSAIQADPGVMLKITPPVMPREPSLRIGPQATPDQMAEMLALQRAQQGAVQGLESNAEQADLQVALRIAQAFEALPEDVQEAIRSASSPAIAQLLKLAAMTAPGIKEAPAMVQSGQLPLADQPGEAALQLLRHISNSEMFKLADFLRGVLQELSAGVRSSAVRGADHGVQDIPEANATDGAAQDGNASRGAVASVSIARDADGAGLLESAARSLGGGAGSGSGVGPGSGAWLPVGTFADGDPAAGSAGFASSGANSASSDATVSSWAAVRDQPAKAMSDVTPGADQTAGRALHASQAYQGNAQGLMLDQLLGLGGSQGALLGPSPGAPAGTLSQPSPIVPPGAAVTALAQASRDMPAQAGLSPQQVESGVREGLKLLMDGRMIWQGQFTQGVPLRFERSDAWQADRKALGGMRKGTSIRLQLELPHLGPLEIRALGFGGQVSVRVHAGPGSTETLAGFLPELQSRLRQRGLAGAQVVVDAL